MAVSKQLTASQVSNLQQIPNIGPAIAACLNRLEIHEPRDLIGRDPLTMYDSLCRIDGKRFDPCVLDVFMAVVDFMNGGSPRPWWKFTPQRKEICRLRALSEQD